MKLDKSTKLLLDIKGKNILPEYRNNLMNNLIKDYKSIYLVMDYNKDII